MANGGTLEDPVNRGHSWECVPGSNITYKCSKCGLLGTSPTVGHQGDWDPIPSMKEECEVILATSVMES